MAGGVSVTVTGRREVQRMLTEAPRLIVATAYLKAMTAAVRIIEGEIWAQCPEREENDRDEDLDHLRESIMDVIEIDSKFRGAAAKIGFGRLGYKALWVEYGHRMIGHKPDKKPTRLDHTRAIGFMRRAFDASADRALAAFSDTLVSELRKMYG